MYKIYSFFPCASLCSGAEYLLQVVRGAIPQAYFDSSSTISAAEVAVQLLDYLYEKLDQVCLIQGGEVWPSLSLFFSVFVLLITSLIDSIFTRWKDFTCCCKFTAIYRGFGHMVV